MTIDDHDAMIEGQMDVYDCIEQAEAETGPVKASDVALEPVVRTEEEERALRARRAVQRQQIKRQALKQAGVDMGTSSPNLAERLEASVNAQRDRAADRFKARRAVEAMRRRKNGGDAA